MDTEKESCDCKVYSANQRIFLGYGLLIIDVLTITISFLAILMVFKSLLIKDKSYWTLVNLFTVFNVKGVIGIFTSSSVLESRWLFPESWLKYFGFLQQFSSVYLIESLTHICIERYVIAKYEYMKNGWAITSSKYILFISLCLFFSTLYSVPMLFGVGSYDWDVSCTTYVLSMKLPPEIWERNIFLSILFLQSVKPVLFMYTMLFWAREIESTVCDENKHKLNINFTKGTVNMANVIVMLWTPTFIMSCFNIIYGTELVSVDNAFYFMAADLSSKTIPVLATLTFLLNDERIRQEMIGYFPLRGFRQ